MDRAAVSTQAPHPAGQSGPTPDEDAALRNLSREVRGPASRIPVIVAGDFFALVLGTSLVFDLTLDPRGAGEATALIYPLLGLLMLAARRTYRWSPRDAAVNHVLPIVGGLGVATLLAIGLADIGPDEPYTTPWMKAWVVCSALVVTLRVFVALCHRAQLIRGKGSRPTLIVGAGAIGARLGRRLAGAPDYGLEPIGFLDDAPLPEAAVGGRPAPVLGGVADLDHVLAEHHVTQVVVAFSNAPDRQVVELVRHCEELGLQVALVPRLFDLWNHRAEYDPIGGLPVLHLHGTDLRGWQFLIKSLFDRTVAAITLVVLAIPLAIVALLVRLSSPGPVIFRQRRVGLDGREFDLWKFRSMRGSAGEDDAPRIDHADRGLIGPGGVEGDDRRTAIGRIIRRSSIDELPQLFNVLRGEMSLVGPRPERPELVDRFRERLDRYEERHRVKSGITGWAQIHGLRGATSLADRIEMDNFYIEHFSLALDIRILARTIGVIFRNAE